MNQFEIDVQDVINSTNPRVEYEFFNHSLFILTDNKVSTYDAYEVIDAIKSRLNVQVQTGRVGQEIHVDFI